MFLGERVEDLVANRLDMSIRVGNLPDSSLAIRHIRPNHRVLVASEAYLATHGTPASSTSCTITAVWRWSGTVW